MIAYLHKVVLVNEHAFAWNAIRVSVCIGAVLMEGLLGREVHVAGFTLVVVSLIVSIAVVYVHLIPMVAVEVAIAGLAVLHGRLERWTGRINSDKIEWQGT